MDDGDVLGRVKALVDEEHKLRGHHEPDHARLAQVEAELDQCWDLLRQRRAREEFGQNPDEAGVRSKQEVEHYQQ
ncbi:DUF2630 family protein [Kutzneria sp. CA-103260]|uniref:DUF2630 family protein n=1 Tax=Kutzneria sp. CA-103260 TaxID=2802641 RepID=UPI001BA8FE16|nr:DUF2630 family protein [Kutzneria sp. CA-103260]QUQ62615.1 hypothetical protein JJ691_03270 [Kutzneria sp. CA-103260]